jgi:hypothetical protein
VLQIQGVTPLNFKSSKLVSQGHRLGTTCCVSLFFKKEKALCIHPLCFYQPLFYQGDPLKTLCNPLYCLTCRVTRCGKATAHVRGASTVHPLGLTRGCGGPVPGNTSEALSSLGWGVLATGPPKMSTVTPRSCQGGYVRRSLSNAHVRSVVAKRKPIMNIIQQCLYLATYYLISICGRLEELDGLVVRVRNVPQGQPSDG